MTGKRFYSIFLGCIACTIALYAQTSTPIQYDLEKKDPRIKFTFADTAGNTYLRTLREQYKLADLVKNAATDKEKVLMVLNWTHDQWQHNGDNQPSQPDALTILREAKEGKQFRCVEYGTVLCMALQSLGIPARKLGLKTADVETRPYGAGHVLTEVWLADLHKWVLADGQFNIIPVLNDTPLNAVELQQAIATEKPVRFINIDGAVNKKYREKYIGFVTQYLFYLDAEFDQRNIPTAFKNKIDGKPSIMLVPIGAKNPTVFQIKYPLNYFVYTNSLKDFYAEPKKDVKE
jgi:hypothetical protein